MKEYRIRIELENEAFAPLGDFNPEEAAAVEVGRILEEITDHINTHGELPERGLQDINGNTVGAATFGPEGRPR